MPLTADSTFSSAPPADDVRKDSSGTRTEKNRPAASSQRRRDSTLSALLTTLEKENSLNANALKDSAAAASGKKLLQNKRSMNRLGQELVLIARQHPKPFIVALAILFIIGMWLIVAGTAQKKTDRRFMTTTRLSLMDGEVQRACVYIEKHFADPALTPGVVCAALVTGESFIEALFQKELGMSIAAFIAQTRIHRAKQFIKDNPSATIQAIAVQSGFCDVKAFEEHFEKLTSLSFDDYPRK